MHDRSGLIPTPSPDDVETARFHLHHALDGALEALLLLDPCRATWPVPVGSLDHALAADPRVVRARRRVRDVVARLREVLTDDRDLDDLDEAVARGLGEAAEAGFRLGLVVSRSGSSS